MTLTGWITIVAFAVILTALALPLGRYMAAVYSGGRTWLDPVLGPVERLLYTGLRTDPDEGQDWKAYAKSTPVVLTVRMAAALPDPAHPDVLGTSPG